MRILLVALIMLTACAENEKQIGGSNPHDALFRHWREPNSGHELHMEGGHFGDFPVSYQAGPKDCRCNLAVNGYVDHGDLELRFCAYNGESDADCEALNMQRTYELGNDSLRVCHVGGTSCVTYY